MAGDGYRGYRPLPKRVEVVGPREQGVNYIGMAEAHLCILEEQMRLFGQDIGSRTVSLPDGTVVECFKNSGMAQVRITTKSKKRRQPKAPLECFCNCSFTQAYIVGPSANTPAYPNENRRYDVRACNTKTYYVEYKNCLPSDQIDYTAEAKKYGRNSIEGMPVILFIDNDRSPEDAAGCSETSTVGNVSRTACQGAPVRDDDYPIYRIIPIFSSFTKWSPPDGGIITDPAGRVKNGR